MQRHLLASASLISLLAFSAVTPAAAQANPEPIKIGYLVDASGPMQGIFKATLDAFRMHIDGVNKRGGVHGRQIDVQVRDVQIDPARSVSGAQELANQGAIAIAGLSLTSTHIPVFNAMGRLGVPVVAGFPANFNVVLPPAPRKGVYGIGLVFDLTGEAGGELARKAAPQGKTFVCTGFESPGIVLSCDHAVKAAKAHGFANAETVLFPLTLRDFRSVSEKIVSIKPDVVLTAIGRGRTLSMLPALSEAGYKGAVLSMEAGTGDDELRQAAKAAPNLAVFSYSRYAGAGQSSGPGVAELAAAAKAAGVQEVLAFHSGGWTLGRVLVDALERCGPNCTRDGLDAALSNTRIDTGGLTDEPIVFTKTDHYGPSSYRLYTYDRAKDALNPTGDVLRVSSTPKYK